MKKFGLLVLVIIVGFGLVGCYTDYSKKDMELISVNVYDKDNNELVGSYKNYFNGIHDTSSVDLAAAATQLNSAAPVENYYCVEGKENETYTVKFTFHSTKGYTLTKLVLTNNPSVGAYPKESIECTDIEKVDDNYVVTLIVEELKEANQWYKTIYWYNKEKQNTFSTMGSNTYIKGVYFNLLDQQTSC